jgi:choline-sulfatase
MKRLFLQFAFLSVCAIAIFGCRAERKKELKDGGEASKPNVVLITIDTFRADRVRGIGNGARYTQMIDRLADRGVLFTDCIAAAPVTGPAITAILTGAFPTRTGVRYNLQQLPTSTRTIAGVLTKAGYATAGFVSTSMLDGEFGFGKQFDYYRDKVDEAYSDTQYERDAKDLNAEAIPWIHAHSTGRPFFIWIHYFDPHYPYKARYGADAGKSYSEKFLYDLYKKQDIKTIKREYPKIVSYYDQELFYTDKQVGKVLHELERLKILNNTLVIVTGDHGEELFEHENFFGHARSLYNTVLHVPLIIRLPGGKPAGKRCSLTIRTIDIFPTILEVAGIKPPSGMQSESLLPVISGAEKAPRPAFSLREPYDFFWEGNAVAVNYGPWKLMDFEKTGDRLFNLDKDPKEVKNILKSSPLQERELRSLIENNLYKDEQYKPSAAPRLSEKNKKTLKTLGYLK